MRHVRQSAALVVFVLTLAGHGASGQAAAQPTRNQDGSNWPIDPDTAPRPRGHASRASSPIVVDGRLDEEAWRDGEPITGFVQAIPDAGYPATERTEVRIRYDEKNLYVGAICYDSKPDEIVVKTLEKDFPGFTVHEIDTFGVFLDTFLDRKNAFMWFINPMGAYQDGQAFDDSRNLDFAWDGVVFIKTQVQDFGWTVEVAIPWTTLRFDPTRKEQVWGAQFIRRVRRRNEEAFWAPLDRRDKGHRMSKAGTLDGLPTFQAGRNLSVTPYGLAKTSSGDAVPERDAGDQYNGGVDVKYGVTSRLTMDLTYRTDFSEADVDQQRVNLTRFPLFFPEKRDFFVENSGTFQLGDVTERSYRTGSSLQDFTLFHSRRIGLSADRRPVPIVGGGRLTGHAGAFEIGLLDVQTESFESGPPENFAVVRARRTLAGDSDVGFLVGNRQATDGSGLYNRTYGVDGNFKLLGHMVINSYLAATQEPGTTGNNTAARISVGWRDRVWDATTFVRQIGDDFNPGIGFVRRNDVRHVYATVGAHPRPPIPFVLEMNPYVEGHYITDLRDVLQTRTGTVGLEVTFRDGGTFLVTYNDQFEYLDKPFVVHPDAVVPIGSYDFGETSVEYTSNKGRPLAGTIEASKGGYYDGSRWSVGGSVVWQPDYHIYFDVSVTRNQVSLPGKSFSADVYGAEIRYSFSTSLFFSAYSQYNAETGDVVTNLRMNLIHAPLSDLFVVYTERRDAAGAGLQERYLTLKLTKLFEF